MKFAITLVSLLCLMMSCGGDTSTSSENLGDQDSLKIDVKQIDKPSIQVTLQKEPKAIVSNWIAYITAQDEINGLSKANVDEVVIKAPNYAKIITELKNTLPDEFKSYAVISRIAVLETKTKVLEQLTKRQTLNNPEVERLAFEIPQDFENFKLQLNEVFLKTPDQFEIELDDRLDSLQKVNENRLPEELQPVQNN